MNTEWTAGLNTLQNASEFGTVLLHKSRFKKVIGRLIFILTGTACMENIF